MASFKSASLNGFSWLAGANFFQYAIQFISLIILTRLLTPEDFGLSNMGVLVAGLLLIVSEFGVGAAVIQKPNLSGEDIKTAFSIAAILGFAFFIISILLSDQIGMFFGEPRVSQIVCILAYAVPFGALNAISNALMTRSLRFKELAIINVICFFISFICVAIPLAYFDYGYFSLVIGYCTLTITTSVNLFILTHRDVSFGWSNKSAAKLIRFGAGSSISDIANFGAIQGDNFIIARFLGAFSLGIYSRAYQLMVLPVTLIGQSIAKIMFPIFSKIQNQPDRITKILKKSTHILCQVSFFIAGGTILLAEEFVLIIFGDKWLEVVEPFTVLAIALPFRLGYKQFDTLTKALGAVYKRATRQLVYAILVVLGAYAGHQGGLLYVAIGVATAIILNYLIMAQLACKIISFDIFDILKINAKHMLLSASTLGIVLVLEQWLYLDFSLFIKFLVLGLLYMFVYTLLFLIFSIFFKDEVRGIKELLSINPINGV